MRTTKVLSFIIVVLLLMGGITASAQDETINLMHFFGDCTEEFGDATDFEGASTECEILTAQLSVFQQENDISIESILTDWPGTLELNTRLAAGDPPMISLLHGSRLPNYASRGLLTPLNDLFAEAGIDVNDFAPTALDYVTYDGKIYGLPLDIHGHLWHLNVDVWAEAGLVDADGMPIIPTSEEEFLAAAAQMKERTGKPIVVLQTNGHNGTVWPLTSFVYQMGGNIADEEGNPTINTSEAEHVLNFLLTLFEEGYTTPLIGWSEANEAMINGEAGSFINGTWGVGSYEAQVADPESPLKNYMAVPFPTLFGQPGVWSNSHTWVVPQGVNADPDKLQGAIQFLKFAYDTNDIWSRTGHSSIRLSVLDTPEYLELPQKANYVDFTFAAQAYSRVQWVTAYDDIVNEEIQAAYLGEKDAATALADAQSRIEDFIAFSSF